MQNGVALHIVWYNSYTYSFILNTDIALFSDSVVIYKMTTVRLWQIGQFAYSSTMRMVVVSYDRNAVGY